jgi:serine/threonine-protein kinase
MHVSPSLTLVRPVASGGMGRVWIAEHSGLRAQVIVKFMAPRLASSPDALARFSREAAAATAVKSPHVVHMIDHGVAMNGLPFIAMELLEGQDLRCRLELVGKLPPRQVSEIVSQAARALACAHDRGVVHRDIKPDNIFLADGGSGEAFVKVLDFGVAKVECADVPLFQTLTGVWVGTPYYMSPEQIVDSKRIDFRTDFWALGVVAFEALTGRRPFEADSLPALTMKICKGPIPLPSDIDPALPLALDAWFERAFARDPRRRFANALELADTFDAAVGGKQPVPFVASADSVAHARTDRDGNVKPEPARQRRFSSRPPAWTRPSTGSGTADEPPPRLRGWLVGAGVVGALALSGGVMLLSRAPKPPAHEASPATISGSSAVLIAMPSAPPAVPAPSASASATMSPARESEARGAPAKSTASVSARPARPSASAISRAAPVATSPPEPSSQPDGWFRIPSDGPKVHLESENPWAATDSGAASR